MYRVVQLDLSVARDRAFVDIPGSEVQFQVVPAPIEVRIGARDADPIRIDRPGRVIRCAGPLGSIYISNEIGTGVLEFVVGDLRLDFSTATGEASTPVALAQLQVNGTSGSSTAPNQLEAFVPGGAGLNATTTIGNITVNGLQTPGYAAASVPATGGPFHANLYILNRWAPYRFLVTPTESYPDQEYYLADDVVVDSYINQGNTNGLVMFGVGSGTYAGEHKYAGFGFRSLSKERPSTWQAFIRMNASEEIAVTDLATPWSILDVHRLGIAWGVRGGVPFIRWCVDGVQVAEHLGALPFPFDWASPGPRLGLTTQGQWVSATERYTARLIGGIGSGMIYTFRGTA